MPGRHASSDSPHPILNCFRHYKSAWIPMRLGCILVIVMSSTVLVFGAQAEDSSLAEVPAVSGQQDADGLSQHVDGLIEADKTLENAQNTFNKEVGPYRDKLVEYGEDVTAVTEGIQKLDQTGKDAYQGTKDSLMGAEEVLNRTGNINPLGVDLDQTIEATDIVNDAVDQTMDQISDGEAEEGDFDAIRNGIVESSKDVLGDGQDGLVQKAVDMSVDYVVDGKQPDLLGSAGELIVDEIEKKIEEHPLVKLGEIVAGPVEDAFNWGVDNITQPIVDAVSDQFNDEALPNADNEELLPDAPPPLSGTGQPQDVFSLDYDDGLETLKEIGDTYEAYQDRVYYNAPYEESANVGTENNFLDVSVESHAERMQRLQGAANNYRSTVEHEDFMELQEKYLREQRFNTLVNGAIGVATGLNQGGGRQFPLRNQSSGVSGTPSDGGQIPLTQEDTTGTDVPPTTVQDGTPAGVGVGQGTSISQGAGRPNKISPEILYDTNKVPPGFHGTQNSSGGGLFGSTSGSGGGGSYHAFKPSGNYKTIQAFDNNLAGKHSYFQMQTCAICGQTGIAAIHNKPGTPQKASALD